MAFLTAAALKTLGAGRHRTKHRKLHLNHPVIGLLMSIILALSIILEPSSVNAISIQGQESTFGQPAGELNYAEQAPRVAYPDSGINPNNPNVNQASAQYRFFKGTVWKDPLPNNQGKMNVAFDAVANTLSGLSPDDRISILPVNLAFGDNSTRYSWISFGIEFNYDGSIDFGLKQNEYYNDGSSSEGDYSNSRYWSTSASGTQNIPVPYIVGHSYLAELNSNQFVLTDRNTQGYWIQELTVPADHCLILSTGTVSPASIVEGTVNTNVTGIAGMPDFVMDVFNGLNSCDELSGFDDPGSLVPAGVNCITTKFSSSGYWRWTVLSTSGPVPVVEQSTISYPASIVIGETADIDIPVRNTGGPAESMTIQVGFPDAQLADKIIIDESATSIANARLYDRGCDASIKYQFKFDEVIRLINRPKIIYPFVKGSDEWPAGDVKHLKVKVTPTETGDYYFLVKTAASGQNCPVSWDPGVDSLNAQEDQQIEYAYKYKISVEKASTAISVTTSPSELFLNEPLEIRGGITSPERPSTGNKEGTVTLQGSPDNITWSGIGTTGSNSSGQFSYWWECPSGSLNYIRASWEGNDLFEGVASAPAVVNVVDIAEPDEPELIGHTMTTGINGSVNIDNASTFYPDGGSAYSFLCFGHISENHTITWNVYSPAGSLVRTNQHIIEASAADINPVWSETNLKDLKPWYESHLGEPFQTRIYLDGRLIAVDIWQVIKHACFSRLEILNLPEYGENCSIEYSIESPVSGPPFSDGTVVIEYAAVTGYDDQVDQWLPLSSGSPVKGSYCLEWAPPRAGKYLIKSSWTNDANRSCFGRDITRYEDTSGIDVQRKYFSGSIDVSPDTLIFGSKATITASTLPKIEGLEYKIVLYTQGGTPYFLRQGATDSTGLYSQSWSPGTGTYSFRIVNISNENYYTDPEWPLLTLTVVQATTSINLISSQNPSIFKQPLTFTAAVNPVPDAGSVQFKDNGVNLGSGVNLNSNGQADYSTSTLTTGVHVITAIYSGGLNYSGSTSNLLTQTVNSPSLIMDTASLPNGDLKAVYSQSLSALYGKSPYSWSIITKYGQSLPTGLKLNSNSGVISGTPAKPGVYTFTVRVTDKNKDAALNTFTIKINPAVEMVVSKLPGGETGISYKDWTPGASGGNGEYHWTLSKGILPPGLNLDDSTGKISGIPQSAGNFIFTLKVTDGLKGSASKYLTASIFPALKILTDTLPAADIGVAYKSTALKASGGTKKYIWSIIEGDAALPDGLDLVNGVIKGKPETGSSGTHKFTIKVEDEFGAASQAVSITINEPLTISDDIPGSAAVGKVCTFKLTASGGTKTGYKWSISGVLPRGLTFDSKAGVISGKFSKAGSFTFSIKLTDSLQGTCVKYFTIKVK